MTSSLKKFLKQFSFYQEFVESLDSRPSEEENADFYAKLADKCPAIGKYRDGTPLSDLTFNDWLKFREFGFLKIDEFSYQLIKKHCYENGEIFDLEEMLYGKDENQIIEIRSTFMDGMCFGKCKSLSNALEFWHGRCARYWYEKDGGWGDFQVENLDETVERCGSWTDHLCELAAMIDYKTLKKFIKKDYPLTDELAAIAIEKYGISALEKVLENGCTIGNKTFEAAMRTIDIDIIGYLHSICTLERIECLFQNDVYGGSRNSVPFIMKANKEIETQILECAKFLYNQDYVFNDECIMNASAFGTPKILKYLMRRTEYGNSSGFALMAAKYHNFECLSYLYDIEDDQIWSEDVSTVAAGVNGDMFKFCVEKGCPVSENAAANAARNCRLSVIRYISEKKLPIDETSYEAAAEAGRLVVLEQLHKLEIPYDIRAMLGAARGGHHECMKWMDGKKFPSDSSVMEAAAEKGHLECLMALPMCPVDENAAIKAAINGHYSCMYYVCQKPFKKSPKIYSEIDMALSKNISSELRENIEKCRALAVREEFPSLLVDLD